MLRTYFPQKWDFWDVEKHTNFTSSICKVYKSVQVDEAEVTKSLVPFCKCPRGFFSYELTHLRALTERERENNDNERFGLLISD